MQINARRIERPQDHLGAPFSWAGTPGAETVSLHVTRVMQARGPSERPLLEQTRIKPLPANDDYRAFEGIQTRSTIY